MKKNRLNPSCGDVDKICDELNGAQMCTVLDNFVLRDPKVVAFSFAVKINKFAFVRARFAERVPFALFFAVVADPRLNDPGNVGFDAREELDCVRAFEHLARSDCPFKSKLEFLQVPVDVGPGMDLCVVFGRFEDNFENVCAEGLDRALAECIPVLIALKQARAVRVDDGHSLRCSVQVPAPPEAVSRKPKREKRQSETIRRGSAGTCEKTQTHMSLCATSAPMKILPATATL